MRTAAFLAFLACSAGAADLGGHVPAKPELAGAEDRSVVLEEMWERRVLAPDQNAWAPSDLDLLKRIRETEGDALDYLKRKFGGTRPWTVVRRREPVKRLLTRDGYEKYLFNISQDALAFFGAKGADAKWALKLADWDGKRLFDEKGLLTPAGSRVYTRAKLKLEVYWKAPNGEVFGTRRPPVR